MCPHLIDPGATPAEARRSQILAAGLTCFARRGFHQTTMQDIAQAASISVGLIYRYFESKEQVIATLVSDHLEDLQRKLADARQAPSLRAGLEKVLWCEHDADVSAPFVVDLFAEAGRNDQVHALVSQVHDVLIAGVTDLIATSPERAHLAAGLEPQHAAEMVFHAIHGRLFDEVLGRGSSSSGEILSSRVETLRRLWSLLFPSLSESG